MCTYGLDARGRPGAQQAETRTAPWGRRAAYEIDQLQPAVALDHFGLRDLGLKVANLEWDAREPALCAASSAVRGSRAPLRLNRIVKASDALRSRVAERCGTEMCSVRMWNGRD